MNKKLLSLVLALVMCLGLCVPAFAASEKSTAGTDVQIKEGDLEVTVTNVVGSAVVPVKFWDYVEGKDTVVEEIITIYYISKEVGPDQTYHIKVDSAVGVDQDSEWLGVSAALEFFALKDGAYEAIDGCAMAWDSEVHNGEYLCMAKVNDDCIYFASEAEAPDNISSIPTADPDAKPDETKPEDAKPEEIKPDDAPVGQKPVHIAARQYHGQKHKRQAAPKRRVLLLKPKAVHRQSHDALPEQADEPSQQKRFSHIRPEVMLRRHLLHILVILIVALLLLLERQLLFLVTTHIHSSQFIHLC